MKSKPAVHVPVHIGTIAFALVAVLAQDRPHALSTEPTTTQPSTPQFILGAPRLPARMEAGHVHSISIQTADGIQPQYRWLTKSQVDDWNWSAPWTSESVYEFRPPYPGIYDVQVDVRDEARPTEIQKKWLGTIEVGGRLIDRISYTPPATLLPIGNSVHFVVRPRNGIPIDALEFRLWDLLPTNRIVSDWRPWPMPAYSADMPKQTGLQIDIRLKKAPAIVDLYWLNDFSFQRGSPTPRANLLRSFLAGNFDTLDRATKVARLAEKLAIVGIILDSEYLQQSSDDVAARLSKLRSVAALRPLGTAAIELKTSSGEIVRVDLASRSMRIAGIPLTFDVSLEAYSAYRSLLDSVASKPESVRLAAMMTYTIGEGFYYGTQATLATMDPIEALVANCQDRAMLLKEFLAHWGIRTMFVEISTGESGHMLIQADLPGAGPWLLDPTAGFVYEWADRQWDDPKPPAPIRLPVSQSHSHLALNTLIRPGTIITRYGKHLEGVVPLVPVMSETTVIPAETKP